MNKNQFAGILLILILVITIVACSTQPQVDEGASTEVAEIKEPAETAEPAENLAEAEEGEPETVESGDIGPIKVGYIPILGFAPFFVANDKGYFADEGLEVEMESFRSGGPMIAPLSLGQLDVGGGEVGPAILNAVNQDFDVRVVGSLAAQPQGYGAVPLLVRSELSEAGEVTSPADLAGLKVAINVERGTAEYLLSKALEQGDLTIDDVELVTLPFPEVPAALANAAVDAAILPHPLAGIPLREGDAVVLVDGDKITDNPQNGVIYFGQRLLEPENHEVCVGFMVAYLRAARELQGDDFRSDDEIVNAILNWTGAPEPAVRNGVAYFFDPDGEINVDSIEDFQAYHVGRGNTEFSDPLPLEKLIVNDCLVEALDRLGEYEG